MDTDQRCADAARYLLVMPAKRKVLFGRHIFDEFAWNMLLALFVGQVDGVALQRVALYAASDTDATVGRRWLSFLESQGMVVHLEAGNLELSAECFGSLRAFLDGLERPSAA